MDCLRFSLMMLIIVGAVLQATDAKGRDHQFKNWQRSVGRDENVLDGDVFSTTVLTPITGDNEFLISTVREVPEEDDESFDDYEDMFEIDRPKCKHSSQEISIPMRQQLQNGQANNRNQLKRLRQKELQQGRKQQQHHLREQEIDQAMELLLRQLQHRIQSEEVQKNRQQVNKRNVWIQGPTSRGNRKRFFKNQI